MARAQSTHPSFWAVVALGVAFMASAPMGWAAPAGSADDLVSLELDNGLQVKILSDPTTTLVSTQVWYHVGSSNETPDTRGFAHLVGHLRGRLPFSRQSPGQILDRLLLERRLGLEIGFLDRRVDAAARRNQRVHGALVRSFGFHDHPCRTGVSS